MSIFGLKMFRWKKTEHQVDVSQAVPNVYSGNTRRLAYDSPSPGNGTIVSRGHLRLFIPDEFVRVGTIRFGSADLSAPPEYTVDTSGAPQLNVPGVNNSIQILHGSRENIIALRDSINASKRLVENSVGEGVKTAAQNAGVTTLGAGSICVLVGAIAGGPPGAAVGAAAGSILGVIVGGATGVAQTLALDNARRAESEILKILQYWMLFLDGRMDAGALNLVYQNMAEEHAVLRDAKPEEIHRRIFDSLVAQLQVILADEGRMGTAYRRLFANGEARQLPNLNVQRARAFEVPTQFVQGSGQETKNRIEN